MNKTLRIVLAALLLAVLAAPAFACTREGHGDGFFFVGSHDHTQLLAPHSTHAWAGLQKAWAHSHHVFWEWFHPAGDGGGSGGSSSGGDSGGGTDLPPMEGSK
jgi:hypothetical protein